MRVAVVGAGVAGLSAAPRLANDHDVVVLERNPDIGGRLATVDIAGARFDAGAQFFTVRGDDLRRQTDVWLDRGVVFEWCRGFDQIDGYPRYAGVGGMSALAHDLATGLDVRCDRMVFTLDRLEDGWSVVIDDGTRMECDAVLLTCPAPQARALLVQSDVVVPESLARMEFRRIIAGLVTLDAPPALPEPGALQLDPADADATLGFVADNHRKGISAVPAVTAHATWAWSADMWRDPDDVLAERLVAALAPWVEPRSVADVTIRRWRFAAPVEPWPAPCWADDERRVVIAGDLFAGPKIEGAYRSGLAAAAAIAGFDDAAASAR